MVHIGMLLDFLFSGLREDLLVHPFYNLMQVVEWSAYNAVIAKGYDFSALNEHDRNDIRQSSYSILWEVILTCPVFPNMDEFVRVYKQICVHSARKFMRKWKMTDLADIDASAYLTDDEVFIRDVLTAPAKEDYRGTVDMLYHELKLSNKQRKQMDSIIEKLSKGQNLDGVAYKRIRTIAKMVEVQGFSITH